RFGQLAGAGLLGLEKPHVLDRNYRLIGEGLQQVDVSVGESAGFTSGDDDRSDRAPSRNIGTARMLRHRPATVTSRVYRASAGRSSIGATARGGIARPGAWSSWGGRGYIRRRPSTASGGKL